MKSKVEVIFSVVFIAVLCRLVTVGQGANIAYISSVASPSHFLWSQRLFERLAEVGHNVTVVNLYKDGFIRGVHLLKLDGVIADLASQEEEQQVEDYVEFGQMNPFEMHVSFAELEMQICELAIQSNGFRKIFESGKDIHFDLVIHDHLAGPCLLSLWPVLNYPILILASAYNRISTTSSSLGTPIYPGFIPNQISDMPESMNFISRCYNFVLSVWEYVFKEFVYYPKLDHFIKKNLNQSVSVSSIEKRSVLAILNSNSLLEHPEPTTSKIVQVGGLHIRPSRQLPPYLLRIIDNTTDGFILLSLGSNVKSDSLGPKILLELIKAMRALPSIIFLWKLDSEDCLPARLPANVLTSAWLPQNDLLAHPKIRLFITHGGLLSTQEAAWHGVPIVGLPIYADQFDNVNQLVGRGLGRRLSIGHLESHELVDCISDVIRNESFGKNAIQLSQLLRDQKESPLDSAIWSIEWVLRNAENRHMWNQSLANVGFLQRHCYDVVIAFTCFAILICILGWRMVWFTLHVFSKVKNKTKVE